MTDAEYARAKGLLGKLDEKDKLVGPEFPRPFQPGIEGTTSAYYRLFESVLTEKPYPIKTIIAPGPLVVMSGPSNCCAQTVAGACVLLKRMRICMRQRLAGWA